MKNNQNLKLFILIVGCCLVLLSITIIFDHKIQFNLKLIDRILDLVEKNNELWKDHLRRQHGLYDLDLVKPLYPCSTTIVDTVGLITK